MAHFSYLRFFWLDKFLFAWIKVVHVQSKFSHTTLEVLTKFQDWELGLSVSFKIAQKLCAIFCATFWKLPNLGGLPNFGSRQQLWAVVAPLPAVAPPPAAALTEAKQPVSMSDKLVYVQICICVKRVIVFITKNNLIANCVSSMTQSMIYVWHCTLLDWLSASRRWLMLRIFCLFPWCPYSIYQSLPPWGLSWLLRLWPGQAAEEALALTVDLLLCFRLN